MKISSMIYWLWLKCNLKATASHSEMHWVHVDEAWIFLESQCPVYNLILFFKIFIRIARYLSFDICKIRNAYVTILNGVDIFK
jgi:hypothetical protein